MKLKSQGTVIYRLHDHVFQRGKLHRLSIRTKMDLFKEHDITIVVALAPAIVDPDLVKLSNDGFIDYIYKPISDGILQPATKKMLLKLASLISNYCEEFDTQVLCHCNAGRNRSGLMNALIIRNLLNCSGAEALEVVRKERPRAVDNQYFEDFLRSLK